LLEFRKKDSVGSLVAGISTTKKIPGERKKQCGRRRRMLFFSSSSFRRMGGIPYRSYRPTDRQNGCYCYVRSREIRCSVSTPSFFVDERPVKKQTFHRRRRRTVESVFDLRLFLIFLRRFSPYFLLLSVCPSPVRFGNNALQYAHEHAHSHAHIQKRRRRRRRQRENKNGKNGNEAAAARSKQPAKAKRLSLSLLFVRSLSLSFCKKPASPAWLRSSFDHSTVRRNPTKCALQL